MLSVEKDTIVAIATPYGLGGVGVVRISGGLVKEIAHKILSRTELRPQHAKYSDFLTEQKEVIDSGIAIYFKAPQSFTGEDVLELQAHGSPVVLNLLLQRALKLGARLAEPGEFSKRAFLNGKIDLLQAESIASLIHSQTEQAARAAAKSLRGEFSQQINLLLKELIEIRMYVEASLDFPEEEIDFLENKKTLNKLEFLRKQVQNILDKAKQGVLLSDGLKIVILGGPNVGKSSLMNLLSKQEIAIVTDRAGTTRDLLKSKINLDGIMVELIDTAGIRETDDLVENLGIQRALLETQQADIILFMTEDQNNFKNIKINEIINQNLTHNKIIFLINKIDLSKQTEPKIEIETNIIKIFISVKENKGLDLLKKQIKTMGGLDEDCAGFFAKTRHIMALKKTYKKIEAGILLLKDKEKVLLDLLAEDLRLAQRELSEITGKFTNEELLGKIFSEFCIGK